MGKTWNIFSAKLAATLLCFFSSYFLISCAGTGSSSNGVGGGGGGPNSWEAINSPAGAAHLVEVVQNKAGHIFAADARLGFFRSTDGGTTWTPINNGLATTSGESVFVVPATQTLIASTLPPAGGSAAYWRSTDEGDHWTQIAGSYHFVNNGWAATVAADGTILFGGWWEPAGQTAFWYSTNDGASAIEASSSPTAASVFGYGVNPSNGDVWLGTEALGLYKSTDNGRTFTQVFADPTLTGDNKAFGFNSSGQILTIGTSNDLMIRSTDSTGRAWDSIFDVHVPGHALIQDKNFILYHTRDDVGVMRSTDGGTTWQNWNTGLPSGAQVIHLDISPHDGRIYAGVLGPTIYRTVNPVQ